MPRYGAYTPVWDQVQPCCFHGCILISVLVMKVATSPSAQNVRPFGASASIWMEPAVQQGIVNDCSETADWTGGVQK